jgi:multiple sugar transport system permease protein
MKKAKDWALTSRQAVTWVALRGALILMAVYVMAPFLWMLISSFEPRVLLFSRPPTWIPTSLYTENYRVAFADPTLRLALRNSLIVSSFTTIIALVLGSLAAYAFTRLRMRGRNLFFVLILATQMLPGIAILIPLYITLRNLGLLFTYQGLILGNLSFTLPYVIWLLRAYFATVPPEIEEAACVDGCSRLGAIFRVVLPISAPGFVSTGIFAFIGAWNEFLLASVMTNNLTKTFPVRMAEFIGESGIKYENMFAAAVLGTIPVLLLAMLFQRYIVRGLTEGAIK